MKTLKHALRTILLALALIGTATTADAYDFMVNGIYYNINGDEATVTYIDYTTYYYVGNTRYSLYGVDCYNYNKKYKNMVIIPESVIFNGNTYSVTAIGSYAFANCSSLTDVTIPNTVTTIGNYAFYNCDGLKEIIIHDSVVSVGEYAFYDCDYLTNITIPNSVTTVGDQSFYGCGRLKSVIIGNMVSSIGSSAFGDCPLTYITCLATTPPSASGFPNTNTAKLYVPLESVDLYRTTAGWNYFTDVRGFGENYFSIEDVTTFHGDTIVIPVSMQNVDEITAFQTDIYLPSGFELLKDGDEYMVELSSRKGRDHVIMANDAPDGAVRILSYSPSLKTFKNNDGELFYLTVKVPDDGDGNYRMELNNTIVTTLDEVEVHALNASNNIKVFAYTLGDVDGSGEISVADIVQTARYILNYNPEPFIFDAADINGDGKISITDVVKIAHLVLDADYDEPTKRFSSNGNSGERMGGKVDQHTVSITLENDLEYTAFQLDLIMPEGVTASDFTLTERANDLGLIVKDRGQGKVRVLGYTADLKTIRGNEGALLTFDVAGQGEIVVDGIQLVTPEGQTVNPGCFSIAMNNVTSVNELTNTRVVDHIDYYNMIGQCIGHPQSSGVTIVVTTYTDGTSTTTKVIK